MCRATALASATVEVIFPGFGAVIMAVAFVISTFGCNNGLILPGPRPITRWQRTVCSLNRSGELNKFHVPAWGLVDARDLGGILRSAADGQNRGRRHVPMVISTAIF